MYEICKGIEAQDGNKIYSAIAWTDLRVYANKIAESLSILDGCDYIVKRVNDVKICVFKEINTESQEQSLGGQEVENSNERRTNSYKRDDQHAICNHE